MDWRRAYRSTYEQTKKDLQHERSSGKREHYYDIGGQIWHPMEMDDEEIDFVARRFAEKLTEHNIREHNERQSKKRRRR